MTSDEAFLKKLRLAFLEEAHEQTAHISSCLGQVQAAKAGDERQKLLETIYREVHNLKGSARAVNLTHLEAVCQALEDLLAALKKGERKLDQKLIDGLFSAIDGITSSLTTFDTALEAEGSRDLDSVLEELKALSLVPAPDDDPLADLLGKVLAAPQAVAAGAAQSGPAPAAPSEAGRESLRISAAKLDQLLMRAEDMLSLKMMARQQTSDLVGLDLKFNPYGREWSKVYAELKAARELVRKDVSSPESMFISAVLARTLDFFDWQQTQFTIMSNQLSAMKKSSLSNYRLANAAVDNFLEDTKRLLMMPSSTLLDLMPKMVRELARELGKEIDLTISGADIQLDKRVLNHLRDPLVHILRNCVDHGIEPPEERKAKGKSPRGSIAIAVQQVESNTVKLLIKDDGNGINVDKLVQKAVSSGLMDDEMAAKMTDEQKIALIFESSLSTSDAVSEISGRGLGMAIARDDIVKFGGRLLIDTERGSGTTFHLLLPATIATFRGVLIKCAGEILVVPTTDIERVAKVRARDVKRSELGSSIVVDGHEIPLIRLDYVLDLQSTSSRVLPFHLIMILRSSKQTMAFIIDEVYEEQEVLVKPFTKPIIRARHLSGVTILGNGKPAPILNVADLIKTATKLSQTVTTTAVIKKKLVLVVDDTITARMLMRTILESAGFAVKTASDGQEALATLQREKFDLIVTDIEMPNMNGLQLTQAIKSNAQLAATPVVMITSMTDAEFRRKGEEAGADAFFVKSSFDQRNLLDVIKNLVV